jgi:hypothetical protein
LFSVATEQRNPPADALDRVNRAIRAAPIALQLSVDQTGNLRSIDVPVRNDLISALLGVLADPQSPSSVIDTEPGAEAILSPHRRSRTARAFQAAVSSHVAVTGTACLSEPSKDIASARRENQCCSTALPSAIGGWRL